MKYEMRDGRILDVWFPLKGKNAGNCYNNFDGAKSLANAKNIEVDQLRNISKRILIKMEVASKTSDIQKKNEIEKEIDDLLKDYKSFGGVLAKELDPSFKMSTPQPQQPQQPQTQQMSKQDICKIIEPFVRFFKDVDFLPQTRFINTVLSILQSPDRHDIDVFKYIINYFDVTCNPSLEEIRAKLLGVDGKTPSNEFMSIIYDMKKLPKVEPINTRLKIYYGLPGSGKTYDAEKEALGMKFPMTSDVLPSDLYEVFDFTKGSMQQYAAYKSAAAQASAAMTTSNQKDIVGMLEEIKQEISNGHPIFTKSPLRIAMENGLTILLDEINLATIPTLRALQSITDGSKTILSPKGEKIEIKEGFKIIGTMNLNVGTEKYPLPEPLVDRCFEIKKYELDVKKLVDILYKDEN